MITPPDKGAARKLARYQEVLHELEAIGVTYRPFVYSAYGAPDQLAEQTLVDAAKKAGEGTRAGTPAVALARWRLRISVAIWRRAARMAHKCLTPLADPQLYEEFNRDHCEERSAEATLYQEAFQWE